MIQKIIEENILDTSLSVWCHRLDGNSMDMCLKTSKYLLNLCTAHFFSLSVLVVFLRPTNWSWGGEKFRMLRSWRTALSWRGGFCWERSKGYPNTWRMWWTSGAWSSAWCPLSCIKLIPSYFSQSRCFHATQFAAYIFIVELKAVDAFLVNSLNETSCNL